MLPPPPPQPFPMRRPPGGRVVKGVTAPTTVRHAILYVSTTPPPSPPSPWPSRLLPLLYRRRFPQAALLRPRYPDDRSFPLLLRRRRKNHRRRPRFNTRHRRAFPSLRRRLHGRATKLRVRRRRSEAAMQRPRLARRGQVRLPQRALPGWG